MVICFDICCSWLLTIYHYRFFDVVNLWNEQHWFFSFSYAFLDHIIMIIVLMKVF